MQQVPEKIKDRLPDNLMFLGYRGSQAHGTHTSLTDDIDLMGVFVAPREHYLGFGRQEVQGSFPDEYDIVNYELRKFVSLLLKNNPNVLSMLWLEDESTFMAEEPWKLLRLNRDIFTSKLAYHSFVGYAHGQLKKMTSFDLKKQEELGELQNQMMARGIMFENDRPKLPAGANTEMVQMAESYNSFLSKYFSGFMGAKRKNNVLKYGYDTKNAAHLIRILRMAIEFLQTGQFVVKRPDAEELIGIKQGKATLSEVQAHADGLFETAKRALETCEFPDAPDRDKAEKLLMLLMPYDQLASGTYAARLRRANEYNEEKAILLSL